MGPMYKATAPACESTLNDCLVEDETREAEQLVNELEETTTIVLLTTVGPATAAAPSLLYEWLPMNIEAPPACAPTTSAKSAR